MYATRLELSSIERGAFKLGAYKRTGELPGAARSAATGSELKSYINPFQGACEVFDSRNLSKTSNFENGSLFLSMNS